MTHKGIIIKKKKKENKFNMNMICVSKKKKEGEKPKKTKVFYNPWIEILLKLLKIMYIINNLTISFVTFNLKGDVNIKIHKKHTWKCYDWFLIYLFDCK